MEILFTGEFASLAGLSTEALKAQLQSEDGQLKEDAAKIFSNLVLDKFKTQERDAKEQQYNRGLREKGLEVEKALKPLFSKFDISETRAEDAIQELTNKLGKVGTPQGDPQELTKEQIAKHPAFKELLEEKTTDTVAKWTEKYNATLSEYEQYKQSTTREKIESKVMANTRSILEKDGRQPVYGKKGPQEALKMFWAYHNIDNVRIGEDGKPQIVDKEGNIIRDEMSNPVSFESFVENNWAFGFKDAAGSGSPPHNPGSAGGNAPIKTKEQFNTAMEQAKTPQEKAALLRQMSESLRASEK